jgi:hypothetical protein
VADFKASKDWGADDAGAERLIERAVSLGYKEILLDIATLFHGSGDEPRAQSLLRRATDAPGSPWR